MPLAFKTCARVPNWIDGYLACPKGKVTRATEVLWGELTALMRFPSVVALPQSSSMTIDAFARVQQPARFWLGYFTLRRFCWLLENKGRSALLDAPPLIISLART